MPTAKTPKSPPDPAPAGDAAWYRAVDDAELDAVERSVLFAAVRFIDWPTGSNCRPSQTVWAQRAGITVRTLYGVLRKLIDQGVLVVDIPATFRAPATYRLSLESLRSKPRETGKSSRSESDCRTGKERPGHRKNLPVRVEASSDYQNQDQNQNQNQVDDVESAPRKAKASKPEPAPLPANLDTPAFRKAWSEWEAYRRELGKALKPSTVSKQLGKLSKAGEAQAIQAIEDSIAAGWTGLFPKPAAGTGSAAIASPAAARDHKAEEDRRRFYLSHPRILKDHRAEAGIDPKLSDTAVLRALIHKMLHLPATNGEVVTHA